MTMRKHAKASAPSPSSMAYRGDIDGLRAIAVLAVVLFHADISPFTGGFVGVDIFFVISGYLITRLVTSEIDRGTFTLIGFYERRLRRLYPALFAMIVATTAAGALILLPRDFALLATNVVGAATFVSNFFFWMQTSYFNGDAHVRALLHTWSLAVEEQYYIFYPLLLMFIARYLPRRRLAAIACLALASFGASLWAMTVDASGAFYLTLFRAWELLLGGLLSLRLLPPATSVTARTATSVFGFGLIGGAVILFNELTPFPGVSALVPAVGAALLIHAGQESLSGRILAHPSLRFLGKISYSVYLWHWPLIVYINYYVIAPLTLLESAMVVIGSIAIGALSWRFIELPFKTPATGGRVSARTVFATASLATLLICISGLVIRFENGFPERFPDQAVHLASYALSMNPESDQCGDVNLQLSPASTCTIGDPDKANVILWGDSHAGALFGALNEMGKDGHGFIYAATPRCPPLREMGTSEGCLSGNRRKLEYVLAHREIKTVILAARWSLYLKGRNVAIGDAETNNDAPQLIDSSHRQYPLFSTTAARHFQSSLSQLVVRLEAAGKRVIVVYPIPETGYDIPSTLALMVSRGNDPRSFTSSHFLYRQREKLAIRILDGLGRSDQLTRVYPDRILCRSGRCLTYADGAALYFDSHHLSIPGAKRLLPAIRTALRRPETEMRPQSPKPTRQIASARAVYGW
jgi:Predicted acyltransferases